MIRQSRGKESLMDGNMYATNTEGNNLSRIMIEKYKGGKEKKWVLFWVFGGFICVDKKYGSCRVYRWKCGSYLTNFLTILLYSVGGFPMDSRTKRGYSSNRSTCHLGMCTLLRSFMKSYGRM